MKILVTGATGYVGGRLVPRLLEKNYEVRCIARDASRLIGRWKNVEVVQADVLNRDSLKDVFNGIDVAYYLIHSMGSGDGEFSQRDISAAKNFSETAFKAGVKRIIYLGGLGAKEDNLSVHLKSRQLTGDSLRDSGIPVTEFRAGIIVGSGSLSFEMIRYLTERLAVMITPKWVNTKTQPIAIRDVLRYLIECINMPETKNKIYEIGGDDILTYEELMKIYSKVRGLKRTFIHVPVLTPRLSSHWIGLVTPLPSKVAKPLVEGLKNEIVCNNNEARKVFNFDTISYEKAVSLALGRELEGNVETIWSGAYSAVSSKYVTPGTLTQKEGMFIEKREMFVKTDAKRVYETFIQIGGKNGWYGNILWRIRGWMDRMLGGIGMRRGRRDNKNLVVGDPLDFWRVEALEKNKLLRLRAEMKLPGYAWLQFKVESINEQKSKLIQTAFFESKGLAGLAYWYSVYPFHGIIFSGMIKSIKDKAEQIYI